MAQSNSSMSSLEALIQAAQYLEENGRKYVVSVLTLLVTLGTTIVLLR